MKKSFTMFGLFIALFTVNAQWEFINPLPPGAYYKSVVHIAGDKYAATGATAIMLTNDRGESWHAATIEGDFYFNCVYFFDGNLGFAGGYDGALLKTIDGGAHWEKLDCGMDDELYAIYFVNPDTGFISAQYGVVLKTTNGGKNWTKKTIKGESDDLFAIKFSNSLVGYATGDDGIFWMTTDGGDTWTAKDLPFWDVYDLFLLNDSTIIAASDDGLYKSTDGSKTWKSTFKPGESARYWTIYRIDFVDENIGYATGILNEIYKTTDGGDSWLVITLPAVYELHGYFTGIAFESAEKGVLGDLDCLFSIDLSTNTWKRYKKSFTSNNFESVTFSNDSTVFAVGNNVLARSVNNGRTWNVIEDNVAKGVFFDVAFTNTSTGYVVGVNSVPMPGANNGLILKTDNGGLAWEMAYNPPKQLSGICFPSSNVGYAVGLSSQLFKTTDGGTNWLAANAGIDADLKSVCFLNRDTGFVCGSAGKVYRTINGGESWLLQTSGVSHNLNAILFTNDSTGFVIGLNRTLLSTTNGGKTWNKIIPTGTKNFNAFNSICFVTPDTGIALGEKGVLCSTTDGGKTWTYSNLPYYGNAKGIASGNQFTTVVVGSTGTVFRKYTGSPEPEIVDTTTTGSTMITMPNNPMCKIFPNPFSHNITIKGIEPNQQAVRVQLFELSGRMVFEKLVVNHLTSELQLNTSSLNSGVYLVRITNGKNIFTQKVLKLGN